MLTKNIPGPWTSVLTDIDRATEFSGDDADKYSKLADLGDNYDSVLVIIPTITSAVISLYIQRDGLIATVPVPLNIFDDDATGHFLHGTSAGTASIAIVFHIGGVQYLRVHSGANQGADRTFWVRGC